MKLGIVGLPNVGKSTLFNAITKAGAEAANYPFCTIEPNVGVVTVPDERITKLHEIYNSKKTIYATIEFCDIAGLVKGASKGEGLGNKFLGHIREVEAVVHVVRCFENDNIVHVDGKINPANDIDTINTELLLSDMEVMERKIQKAEKNAKFDKSAREELDLLQRVYAHLSEGKNARSMDLDEEEADYVKTIGLLSYKPIIYVANVSDDGVADAEADTEGEGDALESGAAEGTGETAGRSMAPSEEGRAQRTTAKIANATKNTMTIHIIKRLRAFITRCCRARSRLSAERFRYASRSNRLLCKIHTSLTKS